MNKELYRSELWDEIKQVAVDLYYLDGLRASKVKIEPVYKGLLALLAIISAICNIIDVSWFSKITAILTALLAAAPLLFPFLPDSSDFSKMDALRTSVNNRLIYLENCWAAEYTKVRYEDYINAKKAYAHTQTELYALFGEINKSIQKYAVKRSESYLERF